MTTIYSSEIEIIAGDKKLFDADFTVLKDTKYAIVGPNGTGKTTLLKHIYDHITIDKMMIDQHVSIESSDQTIQEFIMSADLEIYNAYKEYTILEEKYNDDSMDRYNELCELMTQLCYDRWY